MNDDDYPSHRSGGSTFVVAAITSVAFAALTVIVVDELKARRMWPLSSSAGDVIEVPAVVNMPQEAARELLKARSLRFVVSGEVPHEGVAKGFVAEQLPGPGSQLRKEAEVRVRLSSGPAKVRVPAVVGVAFAQARVMLEGLGLRIGATTETDAGAPGTVTAITPEVGAEVSKGDEVKLVVSPAQTEVAVPSVVGLSLRKAREAIEQAGLTVKTRLSYDEDRGPGAILRQVPEPGTKVAPKTSIELTVNEED